MVPLSGVTAESLPHLQKIADEINGVRFVNTTAEVADSLATYRNGVLYALLIALGVIGAILAFSMRRRFVDFWAPTALSIALTFGLCGFAGIPLSLFPFCRWCWLWGSALITPSYFTARTTPLPPAIRFSWPPQVRCWLLDFLPYLQRLRFTFSV